LLKVGNSSVGLRGLDGALTEVIERHGNSDITPFEAARLILDKVEKRNYIPQEARNSYLDALSDLWLGRLRGEAPRSGERIVRILGRGCVGCNRLEEMVMDVFQELGIAADIEHVRELDEIWRYGVDKTPALVLGNRVVSAGRIPSKALVEGWVREFFGRK
jgi:small redox-active disulfide protein 2